MSVFESISSLSNDNDKESAGKVIFNSVTRGGSRTVATSKVELFVIIVNGFQPLTIITKSSTLDVAAALDPPLVTVKQISTIIYIIRDSLFSRKSYKWLHLMV